MVEQRSEGRDQTSPLVSLPTAVVEYSSVPRARLLLELAADAIDADPPTTERFAKALTYALERVLGETGSFDLLGIDPVTLEAHS